MKGMRSGLFICLSCRIMYTGNVCGALYLFSNKVAFVTSFQKVCSFQWCES